jgi:hypothetical protein
VKKKVKSDTIYNDALTNHVATYDRLWLFSGAELYKAKYGFGTDGFGISVEYDSSDPYFGVVRINEGLQGSKDLAAYSRQRNLDINSDFYGSNNWAKMAVSADGGTAKNVWLRTIGNKSVTMVGQFKVDGSLITYSGDFVSISNTGQAGISPGFCIGERE